MTTLPDASSDPVLAPGVFGLAPTDWGRLVQGLFKEQTPEPAQIDAMLHEFSQVPPILRNLGPWSKHLYPDARGAEPRLRLVGWLHVDSVFESKKFARALADGNALNVQGLCVEKASDLKTLLARLGDSPISELRALELWFAPTDDALEAIDAHPKLQALERFVVKGTLKARFAKLASLAFVRRLRALALPYTADKAARADTDAIAAVPFERLETFVLTGKDHRPKGLRAFLQAPWLHRLRYLQIEGLESADLDVLAESPVLPRLGALGIRQSRATLPALVKVLSSLRACTQLDLSFVRIEGSDAHLLPSAIAEAIAASGCAPRLEEVVVPVDEDGKAILERAGLNAARAKAEQSAARGFWFKLY